MMVVVVGLLMLALVSAPLVCWAMLARVPVIRWGVGSVLLLFVAAIVGLYAGWIDSRARLELTIGFAPASAAVIGVGLLLQRNRVRDMPPLHQHRRAGGVLLLSYLGFMVLCCAPVAIDMENEPYVPSDGELLPLPSGLVVLDERELGCGSGVCARSFTIGSSDGASAEEIVAAVWNHLEARRGWEDRARPCRPNGWLIDRSELCVSVAIGPNRQVHVIFEGARALPAHKY